MCLWRSQIDHKPDLRIRKQFRGRTGFGNPEFSCQLFGECRLEIRAGCNTELRKETPDVPGIRPADHAAPDDSDIRSVHCFLPFVTQDFSEQSFFMPDSISILVRTFSILSKPPAHILLKLCRFSPVYDIIYLKETFEGFPAPDSGPSLRAGSQYRIGNALKQYENDSEAIHSAEPETAFIFRNCCVIMLETLSVYHSAYRSESNVRDQPVL